MNKFVRRVIVLNTKGGCGKTTVATNVASLYACAGYKTALIDQDPQASSSQWLKERPADVPRIEGVAMHEASRTPLSGAWQLQVPRDTERVVVDTPAGVCAPDIVGRITAQDWVLVPILPSPMDIRATGEFVRQLLVTSRLRPEDGRLALVANRTRRRSPGLRQLEEFLSSTRVPALVQLRDTDHYVAAAERGLGVCELEGGNARKDCEHWGAVVDWLEADGRGKPVSLPAQAEDATEQHERNDLPVFLTRGWQGESKAETPPPKPRDLH